MKMPRFRRFSLDLLLLVRSAGRTARRRKNAGDDSSLVTLISLPSWYVDHLVVLCAGERRLASLTPRLCGFYGIS